MIVADHAWDDIDSEVKHGKLSAWRKCFPAARGLRISGAAWDSASVEHLRGIERLAVSGTGAEGVLLVIPVVERLVMLKLRVELPVPRIGSLELAACIRLESLYIEGHHGQVDGAAPSLPRLRVLHWTGGAVPPGLLESPCLEHVDLSEVEPLPADARGWPGRLLHLRSLRAVHCRMTDADFVDLSPTVESLDVGGNSGVTGSGLRIIASRCPMLKHLSCGDIGLRLREADGVLSASNFPALCSLKAGQHTSDVVLAAFGPQLTKLDVMAPYSLTAEGISGLRNLEELDVVYWPLVATPRAWGRLTCLRRLSLTMAMWEEPLPPDAFRALPLLETLHCRGTSMPGGRKSAALTAEHAPDLKALLHLDVALTPVDDVMIRALGTLPRLSTLVLRKCLKKGHSADVWAHLLHLRLLDVSENPLSRTIIKLLAEAIPELIL